MPLIFKNEVNLKKKKKYIYIYSIVLGPKMKQNGAKRVKLQNWAKSGGLEECAHQHMGSVDWHIFVSPQFLYIF